MGDWFQIGSSLINGVFDLASTGMYNRTSKKEARKNRKFAREQQEDAQQHDIAMQASQFQYQQQLNEEQFNYQQKLNEQSYAAQQAYFDRNMSVQAQRRQIEAAGLNPYLAMDGTPGTASSMPSGSANAGSVGAPSSGAVAPSSMPQLEKYNTAKVMLDTIGQIKEFSERDEDIEMKRIENFYRRKDKVLDQLQKIEDIEGTRALTETEKQRKSNLLQQYKLIEETWDEQVRNAKLTNDAIQQNINESKQQERLLAAQAEVEELQLPYIEADIASEIQLRFEQMAMYEVQRYRGKELKDKEIQMIAWELGEKMFDGVVKGYDENGVTLSDIQVQQLQNLYIEQLEANLGQTESLDSRNTLMSIAGLIGSIGAILLQIYPQGKAIKAGLAARKAAKAAKAAKSVIPQN